MSTPAYDGKRQPPAANGWFAGLAAWWNSLTPQYVTHASSGISVAARGGTTPQVATSSPTAPAGATGKPMDLSSVQTAASGTTPSSAPCTAKS